MSDLPEDLLPFYALGVLTPQERSEVEAWLAAHPERRAEAEEMQQAAHALARLAPLEAPTAGIGPAVVDRARRSRPRKERGSPSWLMPTFAAAGLVLAIAAAAWAASLKSEVARLELQAVQLQATAQAQAQMLADLSSPAAHLVEIAGTDARPEGRGRLFADPAATSAVLIVSGLEPVEAGFVYQLWLIRGSTPVPAGLFHVDAAGRAIAHVQAEGLVGEYDALGVSIEPEGGSAQPTGDIVLLGTLTY